ncbi:MAG: hypothetical protein ACI3XI_09510 [Eubacteriales bacterium]
MVEPLYHKSTKDAREKSNFTNLSFQKLFGPIPVRLTQEYESDRIDADAGERVRPLFVAYIRLIDVNDNLTVKGSLFSKQIEF